jgi:hypothetical protein
MPIRVLSVLLLLALFVGLVAVSAGWLDPQVNGKWAGERPFPAQTIPPNSRQTIPLPESFPPTNYSLRLTAVPQSGDPDVGYGLAIGDGAAQVRVLLSPLGYALVEVGETAVLPWQPWPHVRTGGAANELWLDVGGVAGNGRLAIRVNRELLWQGPIGDLTGVVGLVLEGYGGETAVVDFNLEWFKQSQ